MPKEYIKTGMTARLQRLVITLFPPDCFKYFLQGDKEALLQLLLYVVTLIPNASNLPKNISVSDIEMALRFMESEIYITVRAYIHDGFPRTEAGYVANDARAVPRDSALLYGTARAFANAASGLMVKFSPDIHVATGTNNVGLKKQLARSLTHVSEMLVDMEKKIELERQILSEFDKKINDKGLVDQPDYEGITDIWWTTAKSTEDGPEGATVAATTATPGKYGNFTITIITTPSIFPRPIPTSTFATLPINWHLGPSTTESPFIADLKHNMALNHHGYFTAFVERFTEFVHTKSTSDGYPVAHYLAILLKRNADSGKFNNLGPDLLGGLEVKLAMFEMMTPLQVKQQAGVVHYMVKLVDTLPDDIKSLLKFYDTMFTEEEGKKLFESLEPFYVYPEAKIAVPSIGDRIFSATFAPYFRSEGTRQQRRLIEHIFMAAHELDPDFRAQEMSLLNNSDTDANRSIKDHNPPANPERRSINYKKIVKHFLMKHPKLFRKIKRQYKHDKKRMHHRLSHMRKRHHNYRKSRGEHKRRGHLYEQIRQRAHTGSSCEPKNQEVETDSSKSNAYYREHTTAHQQKDIQKAQRNKIRFGNRKRHTQKHRIAQQNQWNLLKGIRLTTKPYRDDPQYVKQLAIYLLRNKQQRQSFYRNRRFNIPSSEEEICNHSQDFVDSIEMLHKIREASSYSDEEEYLRNNLYDALRHGNRTLASLRRSGDDKNNKQTLRSLSSETDEEWVLKNNIYKVFEREKKYLL